MHTNREGVLHGTIKVIRKKHMKKLCITLIFSVIMIGCKKTEAPKPVESDHPFVAGVNIGAYYFGGWYENSHHLTGFEK